MKIRKTEPTGKLKSDSAWIYGINPVIEAIRAGRDVKTVYISSSRHEKISDIVREAETRKIEISISAPGFFDRSFGKGHQGVAAEVAMKAYEDLDALLDIPSQRKEVPLFLILDCLEDPRNLGAILRVADAAGIHGIVMQSHRSVSLSADVSKVSAGAIEYVPVSLVVNIKHAIREMKTRGLTIVGADAGAPTLLWETDLTSPLGLVIGSEGKGLRKTVGQMCDIIMHIPMFGNINSLNVSVATGILLYEILRQRLKIS